MVVLCVVGEGLVDVRFVIKVVLFLKLKFVFLVFFVGIVLLVYLVVGYV